MASSNLTQVYSSFLQNPRADVWHPDASLHYVTSTTTVSSASDIGAHFKRETVLYKKKEQKVLSSVQSGNTLVMEVSTTIEFVDGGGAIMPGMDDNFLSDQVVTTPMIHFVNFDGEKLKQVRIYWDQGTLLKQLGVVGRSGANWPIRDGKDQVELIKSSVEAGPMSAGSSRGSSPSRSATSSRHGNRISLFAPRDEVLEEERAIAPKGSLKPQSRDLTAIIAEDDEEQAAAARSPAKAGVANGPKRTFFVGETPEKENSTPDRQYKSHPKKYNHFEFADPDNESTPAPTPVPPKRTSTYSKKGPSWNFEDFTTPLKKPAKSRPQQDRHFGWSDEEEEEVEQPPRPAPAPKPRKDADHHFEFTDESPEKQSIPAVDQPLNRNNKMREKALSHFDIVDESPADKPKSNGNHVPESRKNVVKGMEASWNKSSPSPSEAENKPIKSAGIKTHGDGMGGRKGASNHWEFTDEGSGIKTQGDGMGGRKGAASHWDFTDENSGIKTQGDGMGGRKGAAANHWDFGDDSPIQTQYNKNTVNKARHGTQPSGGSFWDF